MTQQQLTGQQWISLTDKQVQAAYLSVTGQPAGISQRSANDLQAFYQLIEDKLKSFNWPSSGVKPSGADGYTLDRTGAAAVAPNHHYRDAAIHPPPRGVKLICINRRHGVAMFSEWSDKFGYTHWAPLPKFED